MPQFLKLQALDDMFHNSPTEPIILNDLYSKTQEDRDYFNNLVKETYTSDTVSMMPRCQCGEMKGEHLVGEICLICETPVKQSIEDDITPSIWFRRPKNVEKLLNPVVWIMLDDRFTKSKFRVIQWLTDRNYNPPTKQNELIEKLLSAGIPRGYNSFVQNFDTIMEFLFSLQEFKQKRSSVNFLLDMLEITHPSRDPLQQLLQDNRAILFSDYIPLLNRTLLVMEKNATGIYIDNTIVDIKDALNTMLSIDQDFHNKTPTSIENRTAKIQVMLADYYKSFFKSNLDPKEGLPRKHGYGARCNYAFRSVITSHEALHDHDEIWAPWCVGVTTFQLHLLNRLMRRDHPLGGMTHNEALGFLYGHVYKYHPTIDTLLQQLVVEAGPRGIAVMNQRN